MKIDLKNLVINSFYALIGDWERIYKHQKSIYPLLKSFTGTCKIPFKHFPRKSINNEFEFLTFSVLPSLTSFWLNQLSTIIKKVGFKITIGDCSGDLEKKKINYQVNIIPIMNFQHGYKLDLFIMHICKSDFIVICDDDIFFLNEEPLSWAKEELIKNKNLAVVSLFPRPSIPERLNNYKKLFNSPNANNLNIETLMGSYCLVIRRKIWIEQGLSFQMYKPKNWQAVGNYFDTADYANLQLIDSGYEVLIAPTNIREKLVCFTSISLWGLRIQETMGNISQIIRPRPNEYDKAYRTAITLKKLNEYLSINNFQNSTIKQEYIMRTIKICKSEMKDSVRKEINKDVMKKFNMLIKK